MLRTEKDYILRMIAAAVAMVARLRERLVRGDQPDEIVREARQAQTELIGKESALLRTLDARSVAYVMGDKDVMAAWIDLMRVEADALRKSGLADEASAVETRIQSLMSS